MTESELAHKIHIKFPVTNLIAEEIAKYVMELFEKETQLTDEQK